jgi:hypothetical protein
LSFRQFFISRSPLLVVPSGMVFVMIPSGLPDKYEAVRLIMRPAVRIVHDVLAFRN